MKHKILLAFGALFAPVIIAGVSYILFKLFH